MSVTSIPDRTKNLLWAVSGGRCEFEGCNRILYRDILTNRRVNAAYIAHIYADSVGGPRYSPVHSPRLKSSITNIMLMCSEHHRLIDVEEVDNYPVDRLVKMKSDHEDRINKLTGISVSRKTTPIMYAAKIAGNKVSVSREMIDEAIYLAGDYPNERHIDLSVLDADYEDNENDYWKFHTVNISRKVKMNIDEAIIKGENRGYSLFAIAPIPLLIYLGSRLRDLNAVSVYQLHREPTVWNWFAYPKNCNFTLSRSPLENVQNSSIAVVVSISASISHSRIEKVLGVDVDYWHISVQTPNLDFIKHPKQLSQFRKLFRDMLNSVKEVHGDDKVIHLFTAIPISIAVEIGRVWNPKSDLPMLIYDNQQPEGFKPTITLSNGGNDVT